MSRPRLSVVSGAPPAEPYIEIKNARGVLLQTTNDAAVARRWAKDRAPVLGDLTIEEVTIVRRRIYTARPLRVVS